LKKITNKLIYYNIEKKVKNLFIHFLIKTKLDFKAQKKCYVALNKTKKL